MEEFFTRYDKLKIEQAATFSDLAAIALRVLKRMPKPVCQVCGPISTGGLGSVEANMAVLKKAVEELTGKGHNVFDQTPFESGLSRIKSRIFADDELAYLDLLEEFYLPLFKTGLISTFYFLPGWTTSFGASWEYEQAKKLGLNIIHLS